MNESDFLPISCNFLKAQEKSRVQGAIGFGFASHWLENYIFPSLFDQPYLFSFL